jgi:hypothetical protein
MTFFVAVVLLAIAGPAAWAGAAKVSFEPGRVQFDAQVDYERAVLTVSMPSGEVSRQEFDAREALVFDLATVKDVADGGYAYELRLTPRIDAGLRKSLAEARRSGDEAAIARLRAQLPEAPVMSGSFMVEAGSIVEPEGKEPTGDKGKKSAVDAMRNATAADQVIPDDLIVQGSACVGLDCVNNENFGFDTIRLKENNLRIHFDDTSTSAGFPANDWRLIANDSASGGSSKFSIEDSTSAKTPFTVTAGAATNSIFVDSTGRVGLRTSTPVLDLHINTSNTPAIRLEQNNSGGFTAQTWDIGANEANFFVRDVTGGSKLSFRIRPGAPTSSVDISADGDVGVGTGSPSEKVHILGSDGDTTLKVEETSGTNAQREMAILTNNGPSRINFTNTNNNEQWAIGHQSAGTGFVVSDVGDAVSEFLIATNGNVTVAGTLTTGGPTCGGGCDRVFQPDYPLESIEQHAAQMWKDSHLPAVGPTIEGAPFNLSEKTGGMLNELEKAHIYIVQLHERLEAKEVTLSDLQLRLQRLEELLAQAKDN